MDKEYVVTLHRKEDLEQFYNEMKLTNFPLVMKRPLSRNTHYMMTEEQAEQLRQDPRVWGVEAVDSFQLKPQVNNEPYTIAGDFFKNAPPGSTINSNLRQWGHLHCAGNQAQRRKNAWGDLTTTEVVTDQVEVFNNGRHVDVVIVDDPVSYDSKEWESPSQPGVSRFVQYQWFNELNSIVNSIDDDNQTEPTGTITYGTNAASASYHGIHVTGTAAGQHYGWAGEANIYNLAVTDSWPSGQQVGSLLIFDYLRAFHLNKAINQETGKRNPTITNHSYGGIYFMPNDNLQFGDVTQVVWQGVTYNAGNPGPSGWTQAGVEADFGLRFGVDTYPAWSAAVSADVQDAIDDGVVIIGAAGNDNMLMAEVNDENWNNLVTITGVGTIYLNRGAWPNSPDSGAINVGALSDHSQFRRSTYTQFGPAIDVFAPGDDILSSFGNTGFTDTKYGSGNFYYPIQGTSMASPQVCGVIACLATGKERFTQADARAYLDKYSVYGDMTFDVAGGGLNDNSCRQGSPNKYLHIENPRKSVGYVAGVVGERTSGQTFPRPAIYNTPPLSIVLDGLVLNLDAADAISYPGSGDTWTDLSGLGNNATRTNSTEVVYNSSGWFDWTDGPAWESTQGCFTLPGSSFTLGADFTIEVWNYYDAASTPSSTEGTAVSPWLDGCLWTNSASDDWSEGAGNNNGFLFGYNSFVYRNTSGSEVEVDYSTNPTTQTWHQHVVVVNSGTGTVYVDQSSVATLPNFRTIGQSNGELGIGIADNIGGGGVARGEYNGYISMVRVYTKALSTQEILQNYNATRGRYGLPALTYQTLTFTVTASSSTNYTFAGDATGNDPTINCNVGDTLEFNLSTGVTSHPFWIKTSATTGTSNGVTTGTLSANGQTTGTMTWNTSGVTPGTYYYICQFHSGMVGQIIVS